MVIRSEVSGSALACGRTVGAACHRRRARPDVGLRRLSARCGTSVQSPWMRCTGLTEHGGKTRFWNLCGASA